MDLAAWTIWMPTLLLVTARVAGIFLVAPLYAASAVPAKLRAFMSLVIALAVVAGLAEPAAVGGHWALLVIAVGTELAVGATIGYVARLVLVGVELGAVHIGQQMGIALGEVFNPTAGQVGGIVRRLLWLLAVAIFVTIGGHRAVIAALLGSFKTVPLTTFTVGGSALATVVAVLGASFSLALKVAAPVVISLLAVTVALGFIQKTVPQCNILSTGLPIRVLLGLAVLAAALAAMAGPIQAAWEHVLREIQRLLAAA